MTDALVAEAAVRYRDGHSLATVAEEFNVDARTFGSRVPQDRNRHQGHPGTTLKSSVAGSAS